jgi:hypothetical protein
MTASSALRASDADREAVAAILREHYATGRLTLEEFQLRLDGAFAARTGADLARLIRDLPAAAASPLPWPPATPAPGNRRERQDSTAGQAAGRMWPVSLLRVAMLLVVLIALLALSRPFWFLPRPLVLLLAMLAFAFRWLRRAMGRGRVARGRRRF